MNKQTVDLGALGKVIENFNGTLHRPDGDLQGVWVRIEYEEYEPSAFKATLLHQDFAKLSDMNSLRSREADEIRITCHTPCVFPIGFWGVAGWAHSGDKIELALYGYDLGTSKDTLPVDEEVTVYAYLTRGRLSGWKRSRIRSFDGTITFSSEEEDNREGENEETIEWKDASRTTTLRMQYEYEDARLGGNKILLQIARPAMVRTFKADGSQSLKSIIEETHSDLKDICLMLSLASREKVQWYEISVETYRAKERPRLSPRAKRRAEVSSGRYPEREDPLIDHRDLVSGGFKKLLDLFQKCQFHEMLKRAVAFEVASREAGAGLESSYILCYAALEAITSETASHSSSLPRYQPSQWKSLIRTLTTAINSFCEQHRLLPTLLQYTQGRLHVLGRPAIADLLLHLTRSLGIKVDDLWPDTIGFEKGLRQALRIRNSLVHRAVIVDALAMHENLVRLQALTERFILKLIGWPDDKVWVWADQPLKWINKV